MDATGLRALSEARVSKLAVDVRAGILNIVAIPEAGGKTYGSDRESADIVPKTLKTRKSVRLPFHAVTVHNVCKHTDEHQDMFETLPARCGAIYHDVGLDMLKGSRRFFENAAGVFL